MCARCVVQLEFLTLAGSAFGDVDDEQERDQ